MLSHCYLFHFKFHKALFVAVIFTFTAFKNQLKLFEVAFDRQKNN